METPAIDALRETFPEAAKDLKLNLSSVLRPENLTEEQIWGTALTSVFFIGNAKLKEALLSDAQKGGVTEAVIDDAKAAAALMGMNTVFYRFRHLVEKPAYANIPARLRMQRMMKPATNKINFELFSMACAVLAGCGACIQAHEASLLKEGLSENHVNDCVRIASVLQGAAVALGL